MSKREGKIQDMIQKGESKKIGSECWRSTKERYEETKHGKTREKQRERDIEKRDKKNKVVVRSGCMHH